MLLEIFVIIKRMYSIPLGKKLNLLCMVYVDHCSWFTIKYFHIVLISLGYIPRSENIMSEGKYIGLWKCGKSIFINTVFPGQHTVEYGAKCAPQMLAVRWTQHFSYGVLLMFSNHHFYQLGLLIFMLFVNCSISEGFGFCFSSLPWFPYIYTYTYIHISLCTYIHLPEMQALNLSNALQTSQFFLVFIA